ncbi:MAG: nickel pincer cofactor biosynthesis protein LarB [Clostridiales Family XIII bacterium]|jgi:NCAIR mutase (PurE)-related protein|nr:nickel pincer cofactor biosynthesis protein LarB [Clostridiales Family XIII bacterium]
MRKKALLDILEQVKNGGLLPEEALLQIKAEPFQDLGFAKPDHHRELRQGVAEVIYGEGKSARQICDIALAMRAGNQHTVLITRLQADAAEAVRKELPLRYFETARIGLAGDMPPPDCAGRIVVATGGTSDMPVAEEAAVTAEALGNQVLRLYDVGVSGLHRLLAHVDDIMGASVVVAVAGMEGALASVLGGLADCPVIGVPTSVGYGSSFGGLAALLSMLNSCSSGVSVVNIDNGFGAGYLASMINHIRG